jgi:starch synthase
MAKRRPRSSVLIIGSEAQPFAKTGGLADVLGALPPALARLGWNVTLVLPRYRGVDAGTILETFPVTVGSYTREAAFHEVPLADTARAILVDCPDLYVREALYGVANIDYPDNALRFAFLTRAALEFAARRGGATVVHAHDWQAGLAPVYLDTIYRTHPVLGGTPAVFTIHNLAFQGLFDPGWVPALDLGWDQFTVDRLEYWGRISFLKGGIVDSRVITTVSRRYAEEIQTPEFGFGFDGILRARHDDLVGILNGIDVDEWDPATDRFLSKRFTASSLSGKKDAKLAVLRRFGLPDDDRARKRPLVGMVSRMVDQKGLDLIAALGETLTSLDASWTVLGTGDPVYQEMWRSLAARHPARVGAHIGFDEALAHLIEAGADLFLMPSRYEPCGLNQMYSMRYGTVPIVHAVGGLYDTVVDADAARSRDTTGASKPRRAGARTTAPDAAAGTGFVFREYRPAALLDAITRALAAFADARRWKALQVAGMQQDFSWDRSAAEYVKIYERACGKPGAGAGRPGTTTRRRDGR